MIVYDLYCANGHVFEGWFDDSGDYASQKEQGLISCPICDSNTIGIQLSAVGLKRATAYKDVTEKLPDNQEAGDILAELQEFIADNFEDVGADFTKEVLKMHYGVETTRNIRGVSTQKEEKQMEQEGIPFFKFPMSIKPGDKKN